MKKIKEKFTIVDRLIFLLVLILIIIIVIPIISDKIEKPKIDKAKSDTEKYIAIVNEYVENIKNSDEELFNEIIKYNSLSKYCTILDEENQELVCGDTKLNIKSDIEVGQDSIVYFNKDGLVEGYKIITNGYRVTYPNSKNMTTIKKYRKKPKEEINKEV